MNEEHMIKECRECPHRITKNSTFGPFYFCRCECGRAENGAHPLSPCVLWACYDDQEQEEPDCYTDEYAIMEGNRCSTYIFWLHRMHRLVDGLPLKEVFK